MATGVDHYQLAEQYLALATDGPLEQAVMANYLQAAQAHATLAVAAASAMGTRYPDVNEAWSRATS